MKRRNLAILLVLGGLVLSLALGLNPPQIGAQSPNQVGLVVRFGDGAVATRCIGLGESEISGYDLLMRSDLSVVVTQSGGIGLTICEIGGEGCPANNCFCECSGTSCAYWSYWHLVGGEWSYSSMGANGHWLVAGDVDGWSWGNGDPPPNVSFEQICAPSATETLVPTVAPTDTPTLSPTVTVPSPTNTPQPADTSTVARITTETPTSVRPTASPTPPLSVTPMDTAARVASTATPLQTPHSVVQRVAPSATPTQGPAALPSPALDPRQATPSVSPQDKVGRSNYVLFGVLLAILVGVTAAIAIQRKR